jgi:hypothetical protein
VCSLPKKMARFTHLLLLALACSAAAVNAAPTLDQAIEDAVKSEGPRPQSALSIFSTNPDSVDRSLRTLAHCPPSPLATVTRDY